MPVPPTNSHDSAAIMVLVLIAAAFFVVYWRTALQLIAIILIALIAYGLIMGLQGL
jgi:hypothetical protein